MTLGPPMTLILLLGNALNLLLNAGVDLAGGRCRLLALLGDVLLGDLAGLFVYHRGNFRRGTLESYTLGSGIIVVVQNAQDQIEFGPTNLEVALPAHGLEGLDVDAAPLVLGTEFGREGTVEETID